MESNPRDYGEQCRFDAFCKKVLRNEARAYLRNMRRQREREAFFSDLSQAELDKLCVVDRYPSDSIVFSSHGYDPVSYTHLIQPYRNRKTTSLTVGLVLVVVLKKLKILLNTYMTTGSTARLLRKLEKNVLSLY